MTYSNDKSISDQAQEYFEAIDNSDEERSNEQVEQDNQKAQNWVDELNQKLEDQKNS